MAIKKHLMYAALLAILLPSKPYAFLGGSEPYFIANYCFQRSASYDRPSWSCPGQLIPSYKTRNFRFEELKCSGNNNTHVRLPESFDEEAWLDLKNISRHEAADILRQQPSPAWSGEIHYQTYIHWEWEDCRLVTDAFICGTYEVCEERVVPTEHGGTQRVNQCHLEPKSCYADITVHENQYCTGGDGQLDFDVEFLKKNADHWNPGSPNYVDRLANGYDLLPGEEEAITVSNLKSSWWESHSTDVYKRQGYPCNVYS